MARFNGLQFRQNPCPHGGIDWVGKVDGTSFRSHGAIIVLLNSGFTHLLKRPYGANSTTTVRVSTRPWSSTTRRVWRPDGAFFQSRSLPEALAPR